MKSQINYNYKQEEQVNTKTEFFLGPVSIDHLIYGISAKMVILDFVYHVCFNFYFYKKLFTVKLRKP